MITNSCQRFTEGRESRRPAGELIKPSAFDVAPIESAKVARDFVKLHHYAGTCSSVAHRFGLYLRAELVGVACFGPPASMNAHRKVFPSLGTREAVSLGRFVLIDSVPGNGESWFAARCFKLLRDAGVVAVESCADPEPRTGRNGHLIHRGHVGTVYSALNGAYIGKTNDSTLRLLPDGTCFNNRASGKIVRGERSMSCSVAQLVSHGADTADLHDDPLAWVKLWRERLTRPMRHHGNHRYLWCLDRRRRREVMRFPTLPYPKMH